MMLHEIAPDRFDITYLNSAVPEPGDRVLCYGRAQVLAEVKRPGEDGEIRLPRVEEIYALGIGPEALRFSFRISGEKYFLVNPGIQSPEEGEKLSWFSTGFLRRAEPQTEAFAAAVGYQLFLWYRDNGFCSRCGGKLLHSKKERALQCTDCGFIVYPRINPSVIIGVLRKKDGTEQMLVTRYAPDHVSNPNEKEKRTYSNYALVAGFIETGESPEQTVTREVLEEVGLPVTNIRYFNAQPWPYSSGLLLGYLCDAPEESEPILDEEELKEAVWLTRENMPDRSKDRSLTSHIMEAFRRGEI